MPAMTCLVARKGRQRLHGKAGHGPVRLLHARHVLPVQPGAFGERVIGHDVLLDETADSCADSGLHDPKLGRFTRNPQRSHYLSLQRSSTRNAESTRFSVAGVSPAAA
jgi:hypothetical protein